MSFRGREREASIESTVETLLPKNAVANNPVAKESHDVARQTMDAALRNGRDVPTAAKEAGDAINERWQNES